MEAVKKHWLLGIYISILTVFAMSYNANAIEAVFDISNYDLINSYGVQSLICLYNDDLSGTGGTCSLNASRFALKQVTFPARDYKLGDIIQFDIVTSSNSIFTTGETASGFYINPYRLPYISATNNFSVLSIEQLQFQNNERLINYYNEFNCRTQGIAQNCTGYPELTNENFNYQAFRITTINR